MKNKGKNPENVDLERRERGEIEGRRKIKKIKKRKEGRKRQFLIT